MITFDASFNSRYPSMYFAFFLLSASINCSKSMAESVGARSCSIRSDEIILIAAL